MVLGHDSDAACQLEESLDVQHLSGAVPGVQIFRLEQSRYRAWVRGREGGGGVHQATDHVWQLDDGTHCPVLRLLIKYCLSCCWSNTTASGSTPIARLRYDVSDRTPRD